MENCWDANARERHQQILSGNDISLFHILIPSITDLVRRAVPENSSILEVGCGTGYLTKILGGIAGSVLGIDPSREAISIAQSYLSQAENVKLKCRSIEDFEARQPRVFDVIVSNMTFHVIPDIKPAIKKISALLSNNGSLIFSIPHPCFWPIYKDLISDTKFNYHRTSNHFIPFTISNDRKPLPCDIPYNHRSLESYVSILNEENLKITRLLEPFPGEDVMSLYEEPWKFPHFMIFECKYCSVYRDKHAI